MRNHSTMGGTPSYGSVCSYLFTLLILQGSIGGVLSIADERSASEEAASVKRVYLLTATGDEKPVSELKPEQKEYTIGVEDVLLISVWRDPDLTREVPVRPDGMISLPLLHDVHAAGKTPMELSLEIKNGLKKFMNNPEVSVVVSEVNSLKIFVVGEVVQPGPVTIRSEVRLLHAISMVGGVTPFGGKKGILIYRKNGTGEKVIEVSYREIVRGEKPEDNIILKSGDTIIVR